VAVTGYGIECLDHRYEISADRLGERRPGTELLDWIVHLAEKEWVRIDDFVDAYRQAVRQHSGRFAPAVSDAEIRHSLAHARKP